MIRWLKRLWLRSSLKIVEWDIQIAATPGSEWARMLPRLERQRMELRKALESI